MTHYHRTPDSVDILVSTFVTLLPLSALRVLGGFGRPTCQFMNPFSALFEH
jgi:hypothetical protein